MTTAPPQAAPPAVLPPAEIPVRARLPRWVLPAGGVVFAIALYVAFRNTALLPHDDDAPQFHWLNDVRDWIDENRNSSPVFIYVINYIRLFVGQIADLFTTALQGLGWPGLIGVAGGLGWLAGGWRIALLSVAGFGGVGALGLWEPSVDTLALTLTAVVLSLAFGIPLGVLTGRSARVRRVVTPVLDVMQIMPTFSYISPMVLLFLIGTPSAVIATVIYAMPPAVRITALAVQNVSKTALEASDSLGATRWQTLRKVQLPLAKNTILLGVNQTLLAALSMVPLTALIAAPGLGVDLLKALARVNVGLALVPGLAIVIMAIVLDRMTRAAAAGGRRRGPSRWAVGAVIAGAGIALTPALAADFPEDWQIPIVKPVNDVVEWIEFHWYGFTGFVNDSFANWILNPMETTLTTAPWWLVITTVVALAWSISGLRAALIAGGCLGGMALLGLWQHGMTTLTVVLVATLIAMFFGLLLGVVAARSTRFASALRPLLDAAQTMPTFSYLLPGLALFGPGRFTAIVASVIYTVPVVIRLVEDGIRGVPGETVEAALASGSTRGQLLWKVQLPMARRSLLVAANQGIVMTLAMVVIGALVGAGALGYDVYAGFAQREDYGKGLAAGVALVLLGIMLDRITQGADRRPRSRGLQSVP
ncbi:ABC transporter permease subunit [Streptosporangiaceae bacterium NEAU-GS5]|nr:ABC transporter permease subunit [Streptosporangiaceae bacterium NEAU-GS5]